MSLTLRYIFKCANGAFSLSHDVQIVSNKDTSSASARPTTVQIMRDSELCAKHLAVRNNLLVELQTVPTKTVKPAFPE